MQCLAAATPTGTPGIADTSLDPGLRPVPLLELQTPAELVNAPVSLYLIRIGARFKF